MSDSYPTSNQTRKKWDTTETRLGNEKFKKSFSGETIIWGKLLESYDWKINITIIKFSNENPYFELFVKYEDRDFPEDYNFEFKQEDNVFKIDSWLNNADKLLIGKTYPLDKTNIKILKVNGYQKCNKYTSNFDYYKIIKFIDDEYEISYKLITKEFFIGLKYPDSYEYKFRYNGSFKKFEDLTDSIVLENEELVVKFANVIQQVP